MTKIPPICPYCFAPARLTDGTPVYGTAMYGKVWVCGNYPRCDAYVGAHKHTDEPLGRLADKKLRRWKMNAHRAFDPLWKRAPSMYPDVSGSADVRRTQRRLRGIARRRAYKWLAEQLGIEERDAHIGMFDVELCEKTVEICREATPEQVRSWAKSTEASQK